MLISNESQKDKSLELEEIFAVLWQPWCALWCDVVLCWWAQDIWTLLTGGGRAWRT